MKLNTSYKGGKIQHRKFVLFRFFFSYSFSFLFPVINLFCSFALGFVYLKYTLRQNQFSSLQLVAVILSRVHFLLAFNCALVSCVTSIFCIVNFRSLLRLPFVKSRAYYKAVNIKVFFCADSIFSSSFIFPVINWFRFFEKIQHVYNKFIQNTDTTRTTISNRIRSSYNTFIQHADTTHKSKIK